MLMLPPFSNPTPKRFDLMEDTGCCLCNAISDIDPGKHPVPNMMVLKLLFLILRSIA